MNKENTEKLLQAFPELYQEYYLPMSQTCMCWGFCCGDGWFDLVWNLSEQIEKVRQSLPEEERKHLTVSQVKEKFGGLRYYMSATNDAISELISEAEQLSTVTCEDCGQSGELLTEGWWKTTCGKH